MKTKMLLPLLLASIAFGASAGQTNTTRHCCCSAAKPVETGPAHLTDRSLYQVESTWTNDAGAAVKLSSLRGRPQIVAMFFANCSYACPLLVYQMQQMEKALPELRRHHVGFTLVSFDTERDTPAALHAYRLAHHLDPEHWTLLRGSPDAVLELGALLDVKFTKDAQGQFLHSNVITLLNSDGEIVYQKLGLTSDSAEMVRRASELAGN